MFVGHTALALAAKARAPEARLSHLVTAVFALDLLWPLFLLLGIERLRIVPGITAFNAMGFQSYPWSHSLVMALVWGVLLAAILRSSPVLVASLVVSHWLLDLVVHRPDLPLWPGSSPTVGLGLWNSVPATLLVEGALLLAGTAAYLRATRARDRTGALALWGLLVFQGVIWVTSPWSPPPPSTQAVAWVGLAMFLFIPWAAWIDRHREPRT